MRHVITANLILLVICQSAFGADIVVPGYVTEIYATYSQTGIGGASDMVFDDEGNLYIAHRLSSEIWRVDAQQTASQFTSGFGVFHMDWGGGTAYGDYLYVPDGAIYGKIRKITKSGEVSIFTSFAPPRHGLGFAKIDRTGNYGGYFYTATGSQDHTYKISTSGLITMFSDFPGWKDGGGPTDIAFDTGGLYGGKMFMSTAFSNSNGYQYMSGLFSFDASGNATRFTQSMAIVDRVNFSSTELFGKRMFALGASSFGESYKLWQLEPDGSATLFATTTSAFCDITFGPDGAMYVSEISGDTITVTRIIPEPPAPAACIAVVNHIIEAQGPFGATVTLDGSCSSDADSTPGTNDDITDFDWYRVDPCDLNSEIYIGSGQIIDCNLPLGENIVILEVTDKTGLSDSNEITIVVQDTTPPSFELSVSPDILWPPTGKMAEVTPSYNLNDICDESPEVLILEITVDEPGNKSGDIDITDDGLIYLRATRSGNSAARIYTITFQACDASGNCIVKTAAVSVPHSKK